MARDLDIDAQLFFYLADAGLLSSLIRFELAARELPAALELAISALAGEDLIAVEDDCCCYVDGFHEDAPGVEIFSHRL